MSRLEQKGSLGAIDAPRGINIADIIGELESTARETLNTCVVAADKLRLVDACDSSPEEDAGDIIERLQRLGRQLYAIQCQANRINESLG